LDGLDIPVVQFFDASFAEHLDVDEQPINCPLGDSDARYGADLLPVDQKPGGGTSPVFNYPFSRTREALERMRRVND
jgi:gentisate 1,2-dioxygenase